MTHSNTKAITLQLTPAQAQVVHAALIKAYSDARHQLTHWIALHECEQASPVTRAESWKTYRSWQQTERQVSDAIDAIRASGVELTFSAFNRFA